ncbi:hypothetical protein BN1723_012201 [Verticillium longisporum]|uniref:Uncharacterized protein n=1 Tax=Verticillium longisporum TaxID=100787 RepID=A0A0G4LFW2_VERLO|nr:hypothetical protein BN1723_012201 [Verticillium longisporum]
MLSLLGTTRRTLLSTILVLAYHSPSKQDHGRDPASEPTASLNLVNRPSTHGRCHASILPPSTTQFSGVNSKVPLATLVPLRMSIFSPIAVTPTPILSILHEPVRGIRGRGSSRRSGRGQLLRLLRRRRVAEVMAVGGVVSRQADDLAAAGALAALEGLEGLDLLPAAARQVLDVGDLDVDVGGEGAGGGRRGGEVGREGGGVGRVEEGWGREVGGEEAGFGCGDEGRQRRRRVAGAEQGGEPGRGRGWVVGCLEGEA